MTSALAQRAIGVTDFIGTVAAEAAQAANTSREVVTFIQGAKFFASFVPGLGPVIAALDLAQPIIQKIAAAAPILHKAIESGDRAVAATRDLIGHAKELYAVAVNADPERPETAMKASDVDDETAEKYVSSIFERSFFSPQDPRFATPLVG